MTQRQHKGLWMAGIVLLGALTGCHDHGDTVHQKEPVDMPAPTGTFVHEFQAVQSAKAKGSYWVFFLDEWYMGGTILGPHGSRHFQNVIADLPKSHAVITIQPSLDPELNEKRRATLVAALLNAGIADAPVRVTIGFPIAEDLNGEEAERIYRQMLTPAFNNLGFGLGLPYGGGFGAGYGGGYGGGLGGFGGFGSFGRTNGYLP